VIDFATFALGGCLVGVAILFRQPNGGENRQI